MVKRLTRRKVRKAGRSIRRAVGSVRNFGDVGKLKIYAFANALGIVSALALFFYAVMSWLDATYTGAVIIQQYPIPFSFNDFSLIVGIIETYVLSFIAGWIFANKDKSLRI